MTRSARNQFLKRVKVYILSDVWVDNGTGYCFSEVVEGKDAYLIVKNELDQNDELLRAKIEGPIQFQRQQDTLIVWTDLEGRNIALSFQEKESCASLCDFIIGIHQGDLAPLISLVSLITTDNDGESDITELVIGPVHYPPLNPKSEDLPFILSSFNECLSTSYQKSSISRFIKRHNYILSLVKLFDINEKNKKIKNLHILCNILKTLILYNEGNIIEVMLDDENMLRVVGILEYDPDYPQYKASHRTFLLDDSRFKEILPVKNEKIKNLIKKTFKLQFLKDVVLARLLDDPTFNLITTLIHFNQVEIIKFLEEGNFIEELFALYKNAEAAEENINKKRDGIRLIHQFILISKTLQPSQKTSFYKSLIQKGLFKIIDFVLKDGLVEVRVLGTEIIVSIIEHDVLLINGVIETRDEDDEDDEYDYNDEEDDDDDDDDDYDYEDDEGADHNAGNRKPEEDKLENGNGSTKSKRLKRRDSIEAFNGDEYEKDEDDDDDDFDDHDLDDNALGVKLQHLGEPFKSKNLVLSDDMTLLLILTEFLLNDNNPGLRIQAFEALKSLLDPINNLNIPNGPNEDKLKLANSLNTDNYFNAFYSKVAPRLFGPLIELKESEPSDAEEQVKEKKKEDLFIHLCELINFCSKDKLASRSFFLENHILTGISKLIEPHHKVQVRLAAVRCLKSIIQLNDDYYTRYIISNDALGQVMKLLDETKGSGDLIFSTILDLLEIVLIGLDKYEIRKNYKLLANYIVTNFKDSLLAITTVHSGEDLIKFVEQEYTHMSITQSSEFEEGANGFDENEDPSTLTENILTDPVTNETETESTLVIPPSSSSSTLSSITITKTISNSSSSSSSSNGIVLKQSKVNTKQLKVEKRLREEENQHETIKKRSTFKEKFQNAGKKLASKFSTK